jgi:hypothetical protein
MREPSHRFAFVQYLELASAIAAKHAFTTTPPLLFGRKLIVNYGKPTDDKGSSASVDELSSGESSPLMHLEREHNLSMSMYNGGDMSTVGFMTSVIKPMPIPVAAASLDTPVIVPQL